MQKPTVESVKEFLELFWIRLIITVKGVIEWVKVVFHYYSNRQFLKIDMSMRCAYFFHDPYTISKQYLKKIGEENIYAYGETPLTTLDKISKECRLSSKDIVYELGCGRGMGCFWLNSFIGCKVVGIDYVPEFIAKAKNIQSKYNLTNMEFIHADILEIDYSPATVLYLYGTCLEDSYLEKLASHISNVSSGTKIITVSFPLSDYTSKPIYEVMNRFTATFPWGEADVYLQIKK